jgi:hypothetical protein
MNMQKIITMIPILLMMYGCTPTAATPIIQASPTEVTATTTIQPTLSVTSEPSTTLEPDFPQGCINPTETPLDAGALNGIFVVSDADWRNLGIYFWDPRSNKLIDIEKQIPLSWDVPDTDVFSVNVSPNNKYLVAYLWDKNYAMIRTVDEVLNTFSTEGQEDWNRPKWLDNERMGFQLWFDAPYGSYTTVIYNPFTGEQKNMQIDLPNPYIEKDTGGRVTWVKADIDPSLKWVLYNDKEERLVLWDLDNEKEIASLPSPTDVTDGTWSPDGNKFVIPMLSPTYDPTEYYIRPLAKVSEVQGCRWQRSN